MEPDLLSKQTDLFLKAEEILLSFPRSGLYQGESPTLWSPFLASVFSVYKKEEGPRGEIQKEISKTLQDQKDLYNPALFLIGSDINDPIAKIYQKYIVYNPGTLYQQKCKLDKSLQAVNQDLNDFDKNDSNLIKSIENGLKSKYSDQELIKNKISEIKAYKKLLAENLETKAQVLLTELSSNSQYQAWVNVTALLQPFFIKWLNIDSQMGKDSNVRGSSFEDFCQSDLLPILSHKLNTKDFIIYKNIPWFGCEGEIDLVIMDPNNEKVLALAECKAKLFDIAYGFEQSGPEGRALHGKKKIKINGKVIDIEETVPCFVVSLIQKNQYHLGFESKLKEGLNKYLLDLGREWKEEEIFEGLKGKFQGKLSPIDWFYKYKDSNLIMV